MSNLESESYNSEGFTNLESRIRILEICFRESESRIRISKSTENPNLKIRGSNRKIRYSLGITLTVAATP